MSPNNIPGDLDFSNQKTDDVIDAVISDHRINSLYEFMFTVVARGDVNILVFRRFIGGDMIHWVGIISGDIPNYNKIAFTMDTVSYRNCIQPIGVFTTDELQGHGIALRVYINIVKKLNYMISDHTQYDGAVELWKSLAKIGPTYGLHVVVHDERFDSFKMLDDVDENSIWAEEGRSHVRLMLVDDEFDKVAKNDAR